MQEVATIRNIALVGHSASGKTMLAEAILYKNGAISRFGKIEEGNTVSDFASDETKRGVSINTSILNIASGGKLINFLDTPGYADFAGDLISALSAVDSVVLVLSASSGVEVGSERCFNFAKERSLPVIIFVNKCDKENTNADSVLSSIKERFGSNCVPFNLPDGMSGNLNRVYSIFDSAGAGADIKPKLEQAYKSIIDFAAESDDKLLERYLEGGQLSEEEISKGLRKSITEGNLIPVFFGSATKDQIGVESLVKAMIELLPSPEDMPAVKGKNPDSGEDLYRKADINEPFSAFVFKTIYDPYVGQLTVFRVFSGKLDSDSHFYNTTTKNKEKITKIFRIQGKEQSAVSSVNCGEIAAVAKLKETKTLDTLSDEKQKILFDLVSYPESPVCASIKPKSREDEEKIMEALHKLSFEDPTFKVSRESQTKELLISGLGDLHLDVMVERLKERFGVEVDLGTPKVPYRETMTKKSEAQGKYKKQTGGRGQYGDVWLRLEPLERGKGFEFVDAIVGGVVPKQYVPATEKGVKKAMEEGVLAGYPVVDVKVTIYDGSYHSVDSSDMAFQIAGSMSFKNAAKDAGMVLLEPIMDIEVIIPDEFMGQVSGDINSKRGRIAGVEAKGGMEVVKAQVPLSEMFKYGSELRSITGGRGYYTMKFSHYEIVPQRIAEKIIQESKKEEQDAKT
ncbi:MAG TPA: elongation factor G [Candidatus Omnitrophica bacterium]|nr:elongation factor G [Candidatus Omnitrophota bacterium]